MATLDPEYARIHWLTRKTRGKAAMYMCVDCGKVARDWSQIHGTDGGSVDDYEPRCRSCHIKYDGHPMLGKEHSDESKEKMRKAHQGEVWSDGRRANHRASQQRRRAEGR